MRRDILVRGEEGEGCSCVVVTTVIRARGCKRRLVVLPESSSLLLLLLVLLLVSEVDDNVDSLLLFGCAVRVAVVRVMRVKQKRGCC